MNYQIKNEMRPNGRYFDWINRSKALVVLILFCAFQLGTNVFSQTAELSLDLKNVSIEQVLNQIESSTTYRMLYNKQLVNVNTKVSVSVKNQSITKILDKIFEGTDISYSINGKQIVLTKVDVKSVAPNVKRVTGIVTDQKGEPIIGANILVKGTSIGTVTDFNGNYSIANVPENATLQFTYIGTNKEEIKVADKSAVNVTLVENAISLSEVVAIGYGVQKKKLTTGASVNIGGDDLQKLSTVSPLSAMQSQSAGVSITQSSGKPGAAFKVNIRGLGTIGKSGPLVIIDNVPGGDLNSLNPGDIESIDVLKDAASAAIYGARAANGVILIKTKQGKKGKPSVSYDMFTGVQNIAKFVDVMDAQQYMDILNEGVANAKGAPIDWAANVPEYARIKNGWKGTNWQKEFANKNAPMKNHTLNIAGGSEFSNFSMGMSYTSQEGVYGTPVAPSSDRYTFRLNSDYTILKNSSFDVIKIGENVLYNYNTQNASGLATDGYSFNDIRGVINMHPLMTVYDTLGQFSKIIGWSDVINPIGLYSNMRSHNVKNNHNLQLSPYIEIQPIKNLIFNTTFGYKLNAYEYRSYTPVFNMGGKTTASLDRINQTVKSSFDYQIQNTVNYKFSIKEMHNFNALMGQSVEMNGYGATIEGSNQGSIFDSYDHAYLSNVRTLNPSDVSLKGYPSARTSISSVFGRVNYDYNEKYMGSLVMRADGSSNFAKGKRWGYFPSVAAGWLITSEKFMEPARNVVDYFKLRASWGQNGNQSINPFQYQSTYSFTGADYYFGTDKAKPAVGAYASILPNEDVTWETSEQLNIGFDSRFFNSRLTVNFDWYNKTTKNWLLPAPVPAVWGTKAPYINGGDVMNRGAEFVMAWRDKIGEVTYTVNGNIAFNQNKVTRIANSEGIIEGATTVFSTADRTSFYRAQVGEPIGYFYGYKTAGVWQNQAQIDGYTQAKLTNAAPGDLIYVDVNGDGVIDSKDKTKIGDPNPDAIFGLNLSLGYKGFDLSVSANGVMGNQIAANFRDAGNEKTNYPTQYLQRWHGEGTSNRYPSFVSGNGQNWGLNSDIFIEDGDFLRIQNITLGYDFKKLMPKMPFSQARLYVAANNLFTFTSYYGADPEVGYAPEEWSKGIDIGSYPSARTYMFGLNVKF
jgi:TonB-dependent starch-binding outer membrane protein SusC